MPYAEANGLRLYYELHGEGTPITLVEGIGYATWMWFRQVEELSAHHRVLLFDNRGVGRSDKPDVAYTIRDMADDIAALLDSLDIERTSLLGTSMGGFIAQEFALAYPERLDRLLLACTGFGGKGMVPVPEETQKLMVPDPKLPPEERIRQAMKTAFAPGYPEENPKLIGSIVRMRLDAIQPVEAYIRQAQAVFGFDTSDRLSRIESPTLILHGDMDRVVPVQNARLLVESIPDAQLTLFPGGGHLFFIEQPRDFNQSVLDFLE